MKKQSVFIPVPVEERLPENNCPIGILYKEVVEDGAWFINGKFYNTIRPEEEAMQDVTHWLEKREDVFVLTKEELERVFDAGASNAAKLRVSDNKLYPPVRDFNDWLNQQKT